MRQWWRVLQRVGNWVLDRIVVLIGLALLSSGWQAHRLGASPWVVGCFAAAGVSLLFAMAARWMRKLKRRL